ncbi:tRNA N(3)-methylcytidine methyltransferase METTL2A [Tachyglossus aculeatus]|uniref:tRNA N(3)-methylcytidine methyltransferase METTL2A n=1 Tax=Tachyglossus aculeatus TaxID=9261 RepID=UPI0018F537BC|nr:tRNA N(3)-methylcytidine methyltransferase METTL2A [Tachyglossus aculeatus]
MVKGILWLAQILWSSVTPFTKLLTKTNQGTDKLVKTEAVNFSQRYFPDHSRASQTTGSSTAPKGNKKLVTISQQCHQLTTQLPHGNPSLLTFGSLDRCHPGAISASGVMADRWHGDAAAAAAAEGKRPQFGTRFLNSPDSVFHYNAWDNVEWSREQEAAAQKKVQENSATLVPAEKKVEYEVNAHEYWNGFYKIHENRFFKDRHWLFTEFPELAPRPTAKTPGSLVPEASGSEMLRASGSCGDALGFPVPDSQEQGQMSCADAEIAEKLSHLKMSIDDFPGSSATYRILEVGCGVGNTVFPILQTNNDPGLFVYCCDFSTTAVDLVQANSEYDPSRCFAFVHDLCDEHKSYPMPEGSLDIIILVFVLSAIDPNKMQNAIVRLSCLLKPGGRILLRDYGRYDMAQLRFKTGRCLSENFYVRGDGTRVYFFTQDELHGLFSSAGLEKVQNVVDSRLQVNRGRQLTMYRIWIQCRYRKPLPSSPS